MVPLYCRNSKIPELPISHKYPFSRDEPYYTEDLLALTILIRLTTWPLAFIHALIDQNCFHLYPFPMTLHQYISEKQKVLFPEMSIFFTPNEDAEDLAFSQGFFFETAFGLLAITDFPKND